MSNLIICNKCNTEKIISEFRIRKNSKGKEWINQPCKECEKSYNRKRYIIINPVISIVDLDGEIWKDIPQWEGLYQVSNKGRVKSLKSERASREKLLKLADRKGYKFVQLCRNSQYTAWFIHRLVMFVFEGKPDTAKYDVMHLDDNPANNRLENLKYGTHYENMVDAYSKGRMKAPEAKKGGSSPTAKKIRQYSLDGEYLRTFECIGDASKQYGLSRTLIYGQAIRKQRPAAGFLWTYDDPEAKPILRGRQDMRKVYLFSKDGVFINEFHSIRQASKETGIPEKTVQQAAADNRAIRNGLKWSYEANYFTNS